MSSTNDDLPLNNHSGNVYDSLFADRIDALGKSSGRSPAPNRKGGDGNGASGWPVGATVFIILVLVRACTSHSSSSSSSYRDYKVNTPSIEEPMWKLEQDRGEAFRRQQELLKRLRERPLVMPDNPEGDLAPGVPKDAGRDIREDVDKMQQQPAPPAAPDKPDRGP
ncbi:MAG TPA: hypothetical protein VKD72_15690 [Gemmataceae bacterium]|nr:hypothetical protein [Gemmataceae bacterium]